MFRQVFFYSLSIWVLPGLLAITVHEAAHGLAALYYGDKTAFFLGRTSLNPLKHIDPVGTVIVPLLLLFMQAFFLFGWAKPVPINLRNLKTHVKIWPLLLLPAQSQTSSCSFYGLVLLKLQF